jgi:uncharacterized damage-inducible protein DinB
MPARRTKKVAPRRTAGARRAKAAPARSARKAAPKRKPATKVSAARRKPAARAAAPKRRPAPKRAPAAKTRAPKAATRAAAVRDLERGCDAVLASIRGLSAEAADRPVAPGKWSPRQILLHLAYWDEWMLGVLPAAITRGKHAEEMNEARVDAANAQAVASGAHLSWDDVRGLWATQRALLLGLLAAVPSAPAARWSATHALGELLSDYADHDRRHAAQIRDARGRKRAAFTPAFAKQASGASAKELLLFELERGRVAVKAALQGLTPGTALRPVGAGKWSTHEIVLHLAVSDRMRIEEFESLLSGASPSWDINDYAGMDKPNEANLAPLRTLGWDEALRLLESTRAELLSALLAAPGEPAERWTKAHPFGATMLELPRHDRHHAEQIKNARISS